MINLRDLTEQVTLLPWKVSHDLVSSLIYGRFGNKFVVGSRTRKIGAVKMTYPCKLSPHVTLMFLGLYEYPIKQLLKSCLRRGDVFVDVGANIGHFSALAMDLVGVSGQVHAFEPDPRYYRFLRKLKKDNPKYCLLANRTAIGSRKTTLKLKLTDSLGTSTLVPKLRQKKTIVRQVPVSVERLDSYLKKHRVSQVRLIKIDVEGFEMDVLLSLNQFLKKTHNKPIIMVEVYPYAMKIQGYSLRDLQAWLDRFRYRVQGGTRVLTLKNTKNDLYNLTLCPLE